MKYNFLSKHNIVLFINAFGLLLVISAFCGFLFIFVDGLSYGYSNPSNSAAFFVVFSACFLGTSCVFILFKTSKKNGTKKNFTHGCNFSVDNNINDKTDNKMDVKDSSLPPSKTPKL